MPHDVVAVLAPFRDLVGDALGRAVVYDAERTTAELLQRTLLPPNLPQSDAISIAARYEPVSEGTVAGGDFYDSFFLPDGRLAIVIGDVVGRGVMAATVMGQVRAACRGAALTNSDPASVMAALDRVVWDLDALWPASMPLGSPRARPGMAFGGELFVTMLYGTVEPGHRARWCWPVRVTRCRHCCSAGPRDRTAARAGRWSRCRSVRRSGSRACDRPTT